MRQGRILARRHALVDLVQPLGLLEAGDLVVWREARQCIAQGCFAPGEGSQRQGPSGSESFKLKNAFAFFPLLL